MEGAPVVEEFFGSRTANYVFNIQGAAPDREMYEADRSRVRNF